MSLPDYDNCDALLETMKDVAEEYRSMSLDKCAALLKAMKDIADEYRSHRPLQDGAKGFRVPFIWKARSSMRLPQSCEELSTRLRGVVEQFDALLSHNEGPAQDEDGIDNLLEIRELADGLSMSLSMSKRLNPRDRWSFELDSCELPAILMKDYIKSK